MRRRYVNATYVTLAYGGPEEGGWWYNDEQVLATMKVRDKRHASRVAARMSVKFEHLHDPTPLHRTNSTGQVRVRYESERAQNTPRPHYE